MSGEKVFVGAHCPACRYVFAEGFGVVGSTPCTQGLFGLTICTRCRRTLVVERDGKLRLLNAAEDLLLSDNDRAQIAVMNVIVDFAQRGVS